MRETYLTGQQVFVTLKNETIFPLGKITGKSLSYYGLNENLSQGSIFFQLGSCYVTHIARQACNGV